MRLGSLLLQGTYSDGAGDEDEDSNHSIIGSTVVATSTILVKLCKIFLNESLKQI